MSTTSPQRALCPTCATTHAVLSGTMAQHLHLDTRGTWVLCVGGRPGLRVVPAPAAPMLPVVPRAALSATYDAAMRRWEDAQAEEHAARCAVEDAEVALMKYDGGPPDGGPRDPRGGA